MIDAIVYDAVGTLIHVRPSVAAIYGEVGRRFGSRLDEGAIRPRFHAAFTRQDRLDAHAGWRTSEARERQRWRAIVAEVLDDVADADACFEALFAAFGQPAAWACDPGAGAVLGRWQQRGVRQALASNFDQRLGGVIAGMPALAGLTPIVVSPAVGWRKPAPEFFRAVADELQLPPSVILYVGDDRSNDFAGAVNAGMRALLLDPKKQHLDLGPGRLDSLDGLLDLAEVFWRTAPCRP
jgi:putative hydrolase of the HAD superfamily